MKIILYILGGYLLVAVLFMLFFWVVINHRKTYKEKWINSIELLKIMHPLIDYDEIESIMAKNLFITCLLWPSMIYSAMFSWVSNK